MSAKNSEAFWVHVTLQQLSNMFTKLQKYRPESLTNIVLQLAFRNLLLTVVCQQGYGLLFESSLTFLMLCWTQTLCWSSSCSLKARSSSSALRSISLSAISLVLQPGPTPLKHKKNKCILLYITCSVNKFSFIHVYATEILDANTLFSGCYVNRTQMKHADFDCTYQKCDSIISGDAVICPFQ